MAKEFIPKFDLNISNDDVGYGIDYLLTQYDPFSQFIISIPIKTEYFLKLNDKLNISFGAGLNLNLMTGTNEEIVTSVSVGDYDGNYKDIFFAKSNNQNNINFSSELSLGVNYKTKFALFQLEAFYNRNLIQYPATGRYFIYDLENSSDVEGDFTIDGNFYGLSLNISPKKGWLKKKSKK